MAETGALGGPYCIIIQVLFLINWYKFHDKKMLRPTRAPFRAAGSELMQRTARRLVAAVLAVVLRIILAVVLGIVLTVVLAVVLGIILGIVLVIVLAVVLRIFVHDQIHLLCSDSMYGFAASYTMQNSGSGTGQQVKRPVLAKKKMGRSGKDFYKILLTNRRVMI